MDVLDSGDGELETIDQGRSGDPSFRAGNRNSISRRRSRTDSVPRKSNCTGCANDSGSLIPSFFLAVGALAINDFGCKRSVWQPGGAQSEPIKGTANENPKSLTDTKANGRPR
jgi:hypothetical protein